MDEDGARDALAARYGPDLDRAGLITAVWTAARGANSDMPQQDVTEQDAAHALRLLRKERELLDMKEQALLAAAMDAGARWTTIAEHAGYGTEHAARKRYRRLGGTRSWTGGRPPQDAEASREQVAAWREETPSTVLTARAEVDPLRAALAQAAAITGVEVAETSAGHVIVLLTEDDEDILARRRVRELLDRAGVQWAPDGPGRLEILGPRAAD